MYTLFNNIVSNTIHSVIVCVDFLGTHMANIVLSLKLGVTYDPSSSNLMPSTEALLLARGRQTPPHAN